MPDSLLADSILCMCKTLLNGSSLKQLHGVAEKLAARENVI